MDVKKLGLKDLSSFYELFTIVFQKIIQNKNIKITIKDFQEFIKDENNTIFGLYKDSQIIGFMTTKTEEYNYHIITIGIKKTERGKEYAFQLIQEAIKNARKQKLKKVYANTHPNNIPMQKTLIKSGFMPTNFKPEGFLGEDVIEFSKQVKK